MMRSTLPTPLLLTPLLLTPAPAQRRSWSPPKVDLQHLTYKTAKFDSPALGSKETYSVFLPKDYDAAANKATRYPLVLFLHGMWEDHQRFYGRGGAPVLDRMVGKGAFPKCVFVCANDSSRGSFYINGKQRKVEDMLLKDLLPHIEKTYRIRKGRQHRALLGVSMGGFGALKIGFKNPQRFGVVATHSAAILPEDSGDLLDMFPWARRYADRMIRPVFGQPIDAKLWAAENPLTIARTVDPKKLAGLALYFDCGDKDRYQFLRPNLALHELLKKRKIRHEWRVEKGGNHGWRSGYNQKALPHSLRFIAKAWTQKKAVKGLQGLMGGKKKKSP